MVRSSTKKKDKDLAFSFPPNADYDAEILILGSMPGEESLRQQQYYAYPQNQFWRILGEICGFAPKLSYDDRLKKLRSHRLALWDVVFSCVRPGSMDADIRNVKVNDFESFFSQHPKIKRVVFNGKTAERFFKRYLVKAEFPQLELIPAPSTSPAYASKSYLQKLESWRQALDM